MKAIKEETDGKLGKEGEKSFCLEAVCFLNEFNDSLGEKELGGSYHPGSFRD